MNLSHAENKEWGTEHTVLNTTDYCHKRLIFAPGKMSSLHRHLVKRETFIVKEGFGLLQLLPSNQIGPMEIRYLKPNAMIEIEPGMWHRVLNTSGNPLEIYEYSTHHSDEDVERLTLSGDIPTSAVEARL